MLEQLQSLMKALEAGSYNAAPSTLVQGAAYQIEDLAPVMVNVTAAEETIKLQKMLDVRNTKSNLYQYNRKLSVGRFGGSAAYEGMLGAKKTGQAARLVVPMAYYVDTREHSLVANAVDTFDKVTAEERQAQDAALNLAQDIEFDLFAGNSDFSNQGVFDGNPALVPALANMRGVDLQVRASDYERNGQDLMFASYGSSATVVFSAGGAALTQSLIEDISVRSALNMGRADKLMLDPSSLSAYNKISQAKERIVLAGSPQEATGSHLRTQWTSSGAISLEMSQYLRKQINPINQSIVGAPAQPTLATADGGAAGSLLAAGTYTYAVAAVNTYGEGPLSAMSTATIATTGDKATLTIGAVAGALYYRVYRTAVNTASTVAPGVLFIGNIAAQPAGATFTDLGNLSPGALTGFLIQKDTMHMGELSGFKKLQLGISQLSINSAFYRWTTLAVEGPRKNAIVENLQGQLYT
jgi:hypothetical protein